MRPLVQNHQIHRAPRNGKIWVATRTARLFSYSDPVPGNFPEHHYLLTEYGPSVARR